MAYVRKKETWTRKKQVLCGIILLLFLVAIVIGERGRIPQEIERSSGGEIIYQEGMAGFLPISGFFIQEKAFWSYFLSNPLYDYLSESTDIAPSTQIGYSYDMILLQEGNEEQYSDMLQIAMMEENEEGIVEEETIPTISDVVTVPVEMTKPNVGEFIPVTAPVNVYTQEQLLNYNFVMENFYIVDPGTQISSSLMDLSAMLDQNMQINMEGEGPQILIYHTHSQETFADSIPGDSTTSIVGAGEVLAQILREEYGFQVMHHTGEYDVVRHDYAYSYAEPEIAQILSDNPSIQVVIDLHRDEVSPDRKLVTQIDGRDTAQIMFFNGLSYLNEIGPIDYLANPNLRDNLTFSFRMQLIANEYYPGLTRKIYLRAYRYNMHLAPKYLLIELGAQTNTVEEINNACEPLAHILYLVIGENQR